MFDSFGPDDRTARLSAALGRPIHGIDVLDEASNTTTRSRMRIHFDDGDAINVFVKAPARSWVARAAVALPGLAAAEAGFYRQIGASAPISLPRCHYAHASRLAFLVVLEDLTAVGARFGTLGDTFSVSRVAEVLKVLAKLHGAFWQDRRLASSEWAWCRSLVPVFESVGGRLAGPALMRVGTKRAGTALGAELHRPLMRYARHRCQWLRGLDQPPHTLIHHDCHPGNVACLPGEKVVLCDWQLVRAGPWAADVAYLMATALSVEDRRQRERELLTGYLDHLADAGGHPPVAAVAWRQYGAHFVYPLEAMVITLALGAMQPREQVVQVVERAAAAVIDHDAMATAWR